MCARLKWNSVWSKLRDIIRVQTKNGLKDCPWTGFARQESSEFWINKGKAVRVPAVGITAFDEQGYIFKINGELQCLGINTDVSTEGRVIAKQGEIKVMTRAAVSSLEKQVHSRWPLVYVKNGATQYIQTWDKTEGRVENQRELPFEE